MKSPFAIFRKHARVLTVVLTGLAMFAFIVMDQMQSNPQMFPVVFAALLLGSAFWILGRPSGHANEYGIGGLLLGVVLMAYVVPNFNRPGAAVEMTIGSLSNKDVSERVNRIQIANQFIARAREATKLQPAGNWFFFGGDEKDNAAMLEILNHEAEQMGVALSDEAVSEFIRQVTDGKLSERDFRKIRTEMRLSETELYGILRELLEASLAQRMLFPREFTTPGQYWEYYRRFNVSQEIEVAAVPVSAFISDAPPSEEEIAAFFEKYKHVEPGETHPAEPAFKQPRKIRFAYLEIDYDNVRRRLEQDPATKVTAEEIEQYYRENKQQLYVEPPESDLETPPFGTDDPAGASSAAGEEKPIDPVIAPEPGSKPNGEAAEEKPQPDNEKPLPKDDKPAEPQPGEGGGQFSVADESDESNAVAAPDPAQPDSAQPDSTLPDSAPPDSSPPESSDSPVEAPLPVNYRPLDEELRAEIVDTLMRPKIMAEMARIREKAALFLFEVEDEFLVDFDSRKEPTAAEKAERDQKIADRIRQFAEEQGLRYVELELLGAEELSLRAEDAARLWNEIEGADAEPTAKERQTLDYLLAQATEIDPAAGAEPTTVLQKAFGREESRLYSRESAQDPLSNDQYVYWKLEDNPAEVPSLDDPGVREQVIAARKEWNARKPARQRAEELAKLVTKVVKQGKTMEEALAGKTVTGKKGSLELTVRDTGESFTWLTIPTARSPNPFDPTPPVLSSISAVDKAGEEFMRVVFDELGVGDVGVAPNVDRSAYYVVRVKNRSMSAAGGQTAARNQFMQEDLYAREFPIFGSVQRLPTKYTFLTNSDHRALGSRWRQQLLKKYEYRRAQ